MLKETGALISLQPNASKIASSWGLDAFLAPYGPMVDKAFRMLDQSGKLVREIPLDTSRFGADRMLYHRQDLHTALKTAATSPDLAGRPAVIKAGCGVQSCDPEKGTVTLANGETLTADIIVGADGIHSVLRTAVVGEARPAIPTGISAYRMLVPIELLSGIDIPGNVFDPSAPLTTMIVGHDRRVIMGPGRDGTVLGIVALVPDGTCAQEPKSGDSWTAEGSLDSLLQVYEGFPAWLLEIFKSAPDHAIWQLRDIEPLPTWTRGRAILVGDAAHAMLPTQGQGASQSFEDAEALRAYLEDLDAGAKPTEEQVHAVLGRVLEVRHDRATLIQKYSRDQAKPATASSDSTEVKLNPGEFMEYNCNYSGAKEWAARNQQSVA